MKKIILLSLILSIIFVWPCFCANSLTIDSLNINGNSITVNYNTTGLSETDQVTLITYFADSPSVIPDDNNIKYIDQITKGSASSLNFNLEEIPEGKYQVKMGGTDIAAPDVLSIIIDDKMAENKNFMKNSADIYTVSGLEKNLFVKSDNGGIFVLKPSNNYIAASAKVPALNGYEIKEYGIRINSVDYSAKVALSSEKTFGILLHGDKITTDMEITAVPYVVYEKENSVPVVFYGTIE